MSIRLRQSDVEGGVLEKRGLRELPSMWEGIESPARSMIVGARYCKPTRWGNSTSRGMPGPRTLNGMLMSS